MTLKQLNARIANIDIELTLLADDQRWQRSQLIQERAGLVLRVRKNFPPEMRMAETTL